jgi:lipopolysaccharide transport system permease protein
MIETKQCAAPVVVVRAPKGLNLRLKDFWEYREILYFLVWRDIKVRYKQTALGAAWAILQPVLATIVFTVFFGRLAKVPSDGIPYPVFAYIALVPWQLFAFGLSESANSLVNNQNLIKKVYFPRLVVPLAAVLAGFVDFAIAFVVLLALMFYYGIVPNASIAILPFFIILAMAAAFSVGLWLSALNVRFRDVKHIIPFLTQFWLFATPVAYPSSLVPQRWRAWYGLNPMAGVVDGFRWALLGKAGYAGRLLWVSTAAVLLLLLGGLAYFSKTESSFADVV